MFFATLKEDVNMICRAYEDEVVRVEKVIYEMAPKKLRLSNRTRWKHIKARW